MLLLIIIIFILVGKSDIKEVAGRNVSILLFEKKFRGQQHQSLLHANKDRFHHVSMSSMHVAFVRLTQHRVLTHSLCS